MSAAEIGQLARLLPAVETIARAGTVAVHRDLAAHRGLDVRMDRGGASVEHTAAIVNRRWMRNARLTTERLH